jgi:hypothetical protein
MFGRTRIGAIALAACLGAGVMAFSAQAQGTGDLQGRMLQNSDGTLFACRDGQRYLIQTALVGDDVINAIPIAGQVERLDELYSSASPPPPTPTSIPAVPTATPIPSVVHMGDTWIEGGMRLVANDPPPSTRCCDAMTFLVSRFRVENRSGNPINFEVDKSGFSLRVSSGKVYRARVFGSWDSTDASVIVRIPDGAGQNFDVHWDVTPNTNQSLVGGIVKAWDTDIRNPAVTSYEINVTEFSPRIHNAKWRQEVTH